VTQEIYQSAQYRWQRYRDQFTDVKKILALFITEFGYSWD